LAGATLFPQSLFASQSRRSILLHETHTLQTVNIEYWVDGWYNPDALYQLSVFLRDWRTDEIIDMDPGVIDIMAAVQQRLGADEPIHIVSAYRSPATNALLASRSSGVARNSYHVRGQAIDLRIPSRSLAGVRQTAEALEMGGVGYYPRSDFVHVDVGPVRTW
jgi:uncharacterized protein YcbK (DUF882 family)